eukprot:6185771-Pleurochrysis_carterae.AAC.1
MIGFKRKLRVHHPCQHLGQLLAFQMTFKGEEAEWPHLYFAEVIRAPARRDAQRLSQPRRTIKSDRNILTQDFFFHREKLQLFNLLDVGHAQMRCGSQCKACPLQNGTKVIDSLQRRARHQERLHGSHTKGVEFLWQ